MPRRKHKPKGEVFHKYTPPPFKPLSQTLYNHRDTKNDIPSNTSGGCLTTRLTEAYKRSHGRCISIPYNKGPMMVVPESDIEHIGK